MRQYVMVCYDIGNEKRLRKVHKLMKSYGDPVQFSVFLCQLTDVQEVTLQTKLLEIVHQREDQVMFIQIGPVTRTQLDKRISTVGRAFLPRDLSKLIY